MVTHLGRSVAVNDWQTIRGDTILKLLYRVGSSPFNPANEPVMLAVLAQATGLRGTELLAVLDALVAGGNAEVVRDANGNVESARLTDRGREWVGFLIGRGSEAATCAE